MVYLVLIVFGLAFGSFINALVWRTYENSKDKNSKKLSIVSGRSMCPNCRHKLSSADLVPVFSWIALKGKCRYCHKRISWQYPLIELITAALFVLSYAWWPTAVQGHQIALLIVWLVIVVGLVALAIYDLRWRLLPNQYIFPLYAAGLIFAILTIANSTNPLKALLNTALAVLVGGGIFYVIFQVSKGQWIGGGDVKLGYLLGLIAGTTGRSILLIFLASLIGSIFGLLSIFATKKDKKSYIAFGPYLILAVIIVQLFGHDILFWYQKTFFSYTL